MEVVSIVQPAMLLLELSCAAVPCTVRGMEPGSPCRCCSRAATRTGDARITPYTRDASVAAVYRDYYCVAVRAEALIIQPPIFPFGEGTACVLLI